LPTFYEQLLRQKFWCQKIIQSQTVSREKLGKTFLQKAASKMLVKLTPGVNFINIYVNIFFVEKCFPQLFSHGFLIFWHKNIGTKVKRKMLMKLTPGRQCAHSSFGKSYSIDSNISAFSHGSHIL
jgi:hypothetical protein